MKRPLLIASLLLAIAIAGTLWYFYGRRYHVVITQAQIDAALRAKFPITKSHLLIFRVTYSNPQAKLLPETNRIEIGMDAELNVGVDGEPRRLGGSALVTTGLIYRDDTKQFFLSDPELDALRVQGIPQRHLEKVTALAAEVVIRHLQHSPVYTLRAKDFKMAAAKLLLKDVRMTNGEIHVTLGL